MLSGAACQRRPAEELLTARYDGELASDRAVSASTRHRIDRLKARGTMSSCSFMHSRFLLNRPGPTLYQRGQSRVFEGAVAGIHASLDDRDDAARAEWSGD
jgi:hypothetical protein